MNVECAVSIDAVRETVVESGYEIVGEEENVLRVRDLESGVVLTLVLEDEVLLNTVTCLTVPTSQITPRVMKKMLDAQNGISTSSFQLYDLGGDKTTVALNNFAKLQAMGSDDKDDILSCLSFLVVDTFAARELLAELVA